MDWSLRARRNDTIVEVTLVNEDVDHGVGPFVVRLHPPVPGTPVRVDTIGAGTADLTFAVQDRAYQVMYVSAELLNEVSLIERIRSTEVR